MKIPLLNFPNTWFSSIGYIYQVSFKGKKSNPNKSGLVFLLCDQKQSDIKVIYLLLILIDTNPLAYTLNFRYITGIIEMCPIL